jgi:hypothetical protein
MVTTGIYDYFKDDTSTGIKKDLQLEVQFFDILNSKFQDDNFLNKTI